MIDDSDIAGIPEGAEQGSRFEAHRILFAGWASLELGSRTAERR